MRRVQNNVFAGMSGDVLALPSYEESVIAQNSIEYLVATAPIEPD